ncbi:hypothetical protein LXT21_20180 [Myxococcus sp. K38C18041901]|uniref:hypothetical protein n=1 Tax=Myxococcus guangdongensis TaxID=2906760 RepID=UPI0020A7576A|nr:hypothetical protein [Myxococcus guangdongensis]MCP3061102.1 hypothetical protein [Myxococcus guangdongensis]
MRGHLRLAGALLLTLVAPACRTGHPLTAGSSCTPLEQPAERITVAEALVPGELHEVFDLSDAPAWWKPAPEDEERQRYREALRARLGEAGLTQKALLERSRVLFSAQEDSSRREAENSARVLEGSVGTVGPSSCLEWRLFQRQAQRFPMLEHPTEFHAYVLRADGRLRVYLSGADRVGAKLRSEVTDRVRSDVARGFTLVAHVHNHNFMFDRKPGDRLWTTPATVDDVGGGVAPSLTDVQAYRRLRESLGLKGAWVTNGLESGRFTAEDFDRLSAWE